MSIKTMSFIRNYLYLKKSLNVIRPSLTQTRPSSNFCQALCICEAPKLDNEKFLMERKEAMERARHETHLTVCGSSDITPLTGVPDDHVTGRRVRISELSKHAMQSGTDNAQGWQLEFDTRERWENPNMGWASSGDPLGHVILNFPTEKEAISFCDKNRWRWFLGHRPARIVKKALRPGSYITNYSWNKRCRVSTK